MGPTITRWTRSRLNSSADNTFAPASSNSPRLLWAPATEAHNERVIPRYSLVGRAARFSLLNRRLLNHGVQKHHDRGRERNSQSLGGRHVDNQIELGRLL